MDNFRGDHKLIMAIFRQAVVDILHAPCADPSLENAYRKESKRDRSADAKRFIDKNNPMFIHYCNLLDLLPEYAEKKICQFIKNQIEFPDANGKIKDAV
jgi:hypothetical protein